MRRRFPLTGVAIFLAGVAVDRALVETTILPPLLPSEGSLAVGDPAAAKAPVRDSFAPAARSQHNQAQPLGTAHSKTDRDLVSEHVDEHEVERLDDRVHSDRSLTPRPTPHATTLASTSKAMEALNSLADELAIDPGMIGAEAASLYADLVSVAANDGESVHILMDTYASETDPRLKDVLADVLASVGEGEVEVMALQMVQDATQPEKIRDGFRLLARSTRQYPEVRSGILAFLQDESSADPELLRSAIQAISPLGRLAPGEPEVIAKTLNQFTRHEDEEVRAAAYRELSNWDIENIDRVLLRGLTDRAVAVRVGAAVAASGSSEKTPLLVEQLTATALDRDEAPQVRVHAWLTLKQLPMDDKLYAAYQEFMQDFGVVDDSQSDDVPPM